MIDHSCRQRHATSARCILAFVAACVLFVPGVSAHFSDPVAPPSLADLEQWMAAAGKVNPSWGGSPSGPAGVPGKTIAMAFLRKEGPYAKMSRPDLILLYLDMPRMNGSEVLIELKHDAKLRRLPVNALPTSQGEKDILAAYDMNANCFITKPVGWKKSINVVKLIEEFWLTVVKLPKE